MRSLPRGIEGNPVQASILRSSGASNGAAIPLRGLMRRMSFVAHSFRNFVCRKLGEEGFYSYKLNPGFNM